MSASTTRDVEATIRDVIEPLAKLIRRAGSADERRAAEMIVDAFARARAPAQSRRSRSAMATPGW
jgi:hypothetical protein